MNTVSLSAAMVCLMAWPLAAGDPPLAMYWRRDAQTVRSQSGDAEAAGYMILKPVDPKAKIEPVPGQLAASIVLPKHDEDPAETIRPRVQFVKKDGVIAVSHLVVELEQEQEDKIARYLRSHGGWELEKGKRFEPVLEVRGFKVNGNPATAALIVPTFLELEFDRDETDYERESIVFRGIFVPFEVREPIKEAGLWQTAPQVDGGKWEKCQVEFDSATDVLTFHFLNRQELNYQLEKLAKAGKGFEFTFPSESTPTGIQTKGKKSSAGQVPQERQEKERNLAKQAIRYLPSRKTKNDQRSNDQGSPERILILRRPSRQPLIGRFSTAAPTSNTEMPLWVSGSFNHSVQGTGTPKNIVDLKAVLNFDRKLNPAFGFLSFGKRYSIAPSIQARLNNTGISNDENSFMAQIPLSVRWLPGGCCKGEEQSTFSSPRLRQISLLAGYQGEAARVTSKRMDGAFVESRAIFKRFKSKTVSYAVETITSWEVGRYREKAINTFVAATAAGKVVNPDGTPKTEELTIRREGTASRLRAGAHSTLTLGPKSSVVANLDFRQLLKDESFFDENAGAKGFFSPYPGQTVPSSFAGFDHRMGFIAAGKLRRGTSRYLEVAFNHELTKYFDVTISYNRGELPPNFQFVNKITVGIALKVLGQDSLTSR